MAELHDDAPLDYASAAAALRQRLPEFEPEIEDHLRAFGEILLPLVMSDLARFYARIVRGDVELEQRFWGAVNMLCARGDELVQDAIATSLIEWFAWGAEHERQMLIEAKPMMSAQLWAIVLDFLRPLGYSDEPGQA